VDGVEIPTVAAATVEAVGVGVALIAGSIEEEEEQEQAEATASLILGRRKIHVRGCSLLCLFNQSMRCQKKASKVFLSARRKNIMFGRCGVGGRCTTMVHENTAALNF